MGAPDQNAHCGDAPDPADGVCRQRGEAEYHGLQQRLFPSGDVEIRRVFCHTDRDGRRIVRFVCYSAELAEGDSIAVPNDTTNEARALLLLQDNGIIKLKDGAGLTATKTDIVENPKNVEIVELEAAQVARVVDETAYVVLNGNYALEAGYSVGKDALAYETSDSEAAKTYVNVIAVKEGNENSDAIKALVDTLKSDDIKNYINETYDGAVIPFED